MVCPVIKAAFTLTTRTRTVNFDGLSLNLKEKPGKQVKVFKGYSYKICKNF